MQVSFLGQPDPRGPIAMVATIRDRTGGHYYLDLDFGHSAEVVGHFSYRVGEYHRCYQCGKAQAQAWFEANNSDSKTDDPTGE